MINFQISACKNLNLLVYIVKNRGGENSLCQIGHIGPICGDCQSGYSKLGDLCILCMDKSVNLFRIIAALGLYVFVLILYVW